jgi:Fic family protein
MDNNNIKKVMTFKSGNFVFSAKYNENDLQNLLFKARTLYQTIADLPILPEWSTYLEKELIRRSIFSTAAIEGSPLKEEEVGKIIDQKDNELKEGKDNIARQAIINLEQVYNRVKNLEPLKTSPTLSEDFIKNIHIIITDKLDYADNIPGKYRNHVVKVGDNEHGGIYTPPKCLPDVEQLMKEFVEWINCKEIMELDSLVRAAIAHYHLGLIHPFGNGNGRTIRIIEAVFLRTSGIKYVPTMLSNYYYRKVDDYYSAFSTARKNPDNDITAFIKFMLEGVIESLVEIKNNITYRIRILAMRDYLAFLHDKLKAITVRQYDLSCMLLDSTTNISLKDLFDVSPFNALYRHVSERTARRDISKLVKLQILSQTEKGEYYLNTKVLG